jgi:legumain
VYEGCKIDYKGSTVTPQTFEKVMLGAAGVELLDEESACAEDLEIENGEECREALEQLGDNQLFNAEEYNGLCRSGAKPVCKLSEEKASGKVLRSTKKDKVFVNFVDHGGVDLIGFPTSTYHAKDLQALLENMYKRGRYSELVFYLEACESGSMFEGLSSDLPVYATTAANAQESSWGTYCSPDDKVDGKSIGSCLGDLYSVNWLEDSDKLVNSDAKESLEQQFEIVKKLTTKSHVLEFGKGIDTISNEQVLAFLGDKPKTSNSVEPEGLVKAEEAPMVSSRDIELSTAFSQFLVTGSERAAEELISGVQTRLAAKKRFAALVDVVQSGKPLGTAVRTPIPQHRDCHYEAHKAYVAKCGDWKSADMSYSSTLRELCDFTEGKSKSITAAISDMTC